MRFKKAITSFLLIVTLGMNVLPLKNVAFAQSYASLENIDSIEEGLYEENKGILPELDIRRTILNIITNIFMAPLSIVTGLSLDQMLDCVKNGTCDTQLGTTASNRRGTMMGIAYTLTEVTTNKDAVPVNLAYFFEDTARRIPIIKNTAYAQSVNYNSFGTEYILEVWKVTRNAAYAVMAIVMVVIGVMIMTRKQVDPKVAVTVQNAIPKVIIALILITFSYPIGALAVSLIAPLINIPDLIFSNIDVIGQANLVVTATTALITVAILAIAAVIGLAATGGTAGAVIVGVSLFFVIVVVVFILAYVIMWLMALLKVVIIYFKALISIVMAPLTFAWGAIPGNEKGTQDWFKKLAVYVISPPAMFFMIHFSWYLLKVSVLVLDDFTLASVGDFFVGILLAPLLALWVMTAALKIPNSIEETVVGKPKK